MMSRRSCSGSQEFARTAKGGCRVPVPGSTGLNPLVDTPCGRWPKVWSFYICVYIYIIIRYIPKMLRLILGVVLSQGPLRGQSL